MLSVNAHLADLMERVDGFRNSLMVLAMVHTLPNVLQNIPLFSDDLQALQGTYSKPIWCQEDHVLTVTGPRTMISPTGQGIGLTHTPAWSVMHDKVKPGKE